MKILIVRHGEPDYSIDSLTPKGWREAELLSDRMSRLDVDAFYVSPMGRARDTAKPTLEKMHRQAEILPWLAEFGGTFANPRSGEPEGPWNLMPRYWTTQPELYDKDQWLENGLYRTGTIRQVYESSIAGLDGLLERHGYHRDGAIYRCEGNKDSTIVLFCHFGIAMVMFGYLMGISPALLWHAMILPTTSVTTLVTEERVKGEVWFRCMQMGDTSHLYAADEPVSRAGLFSEIYGRDEELEAKQ